MRFGVGHLTEVDIPFNITAAQIGSNACAVFIQRFNLGDVTLVHAVDNAGASRVRGLGSAKNTRCAKRCGNRFDITCIQAVFNVGRTVGKTNDTGKSALIFFGVTAFPYRDIAKILTIFNCGTGQDLTSNTTDTVLILRSVNAGDRNLTEFCGIENLSTRIGKTNNAAKHHCRRRTLAADGYVNGNRVHNAVSLQLVGKSTELGLSVQGNGSFQSQIRYLTRNRCKKRCGNTRNLFAVTVKVTCKSRQSRSVGKRDVLCQAVITVRRHRL